jgi:hypothetical protein
VPARRGHLDVPLPRPSVTFCRKVRRSLSYGHPWAHYSGGYQDRLLGGPLGLLDLCYMAPDGVEHKDCSGGVLAHVRIHVKNS